MLVYVLLKSRIRHFHVVVVQKQERSVQKALCTWEVVVLLIESIVFLTFSLPSVSLDLKVAITLRKHILELQETLELHTAVFNFRLFLDSESLLGIAVKFICRTSVALFLSGK